MTILESVILGLNLWYSLILAVIIKFGGYEMTPLTETFNKLSLKWSSLLLLGIISNVYFWKLIFEVFIYKL